MIGISCYGKHAWGLPANFSCFGTLIGSHFAHERRIKSPGELLPRSRNEEKLGIGSSGYLMWFILAANLLGLPAISVPVSVVYLFRKNPI
jgi:hypothetical protein